MSDRLTLISYEKIREAEDAERARAQACIELHARDETDTALLLDVVFGEVKVIAPRGFKGERRGDREEYVPCGSSRAYQRHRRRGEPIDDACRKANSQSEMARRAQRQAESGAA